MSCREEKCLMTMLPKAQNEDSYSCNGTLLRRNSAPRAKRNDRLVASLSLPGPHHAYTAARTLALSAELARRPATFVIEMVDEDTV